MKRTQKFIINVGTAVSLALASLAVSAQSTQALEGKGGPQTQGEQHQRMQGGEHKGMHGDKHAGKRHGGEGRQAMRQLMTPEERTTFREKMRSAKTPEERQQIAAANRTELQKRAKEKGITLTEHQGSRGRHHGDKGKQAIRQLMTPEERTAMREKMRSASSRDERRQIAMANRTEMEKRAKEKGITLPEHQGGRGGRDGRQGPSSSTPATQL